MGEFGEEGEAWCRDVFACRERHFWGAIAIHGLTVLEHAPIVHVRVNLASLNMLRLC